VVALAGGAYAASGALTSKQKKEVTKIAKKYAGKPGATGPAGPAGPQGPKGDTGAAGGKGADGVSVTSTESNSTIDGSHCTGVGGSKFTSASGVTYACNGKEGVQGVQGPAGPTCNEDTGLCELPEEATMTGVWVLPGYAPGTYQVPISFPFTNPGTLAPTDIVVVNQGAETGAGDCPGSVAEPTAAPGKLCIYTEFEATHKNAEETEDLPNQSFFVKAPIAGGHVGADLLMIVFGPQPGSARGSWAFTAA
jgi:hypothetical protein